MRECKRTYGRGLGEGRVSTGRLSSTVLVGRTLIFFAVAILANVNFAAVWILFIFSTAAEPSVLSVLVSLILIARCHLSRFPCFIKKYRGKALYISSSIER
uniref:Uncharacterized protein n=1 Tax=Trypanosoma congolense (strain IL3000) TaxID=1068625 RepID=G0V099_TRYCI|nr:hypothetical protein, unlikely [Trypanosoma congolense IL3000]